MGSTGITGRVKDIWHKIGHAAHTAHTLHFLHALRLAKAKAVMIWISAAAASTLAPLGCRTPAPTLGDGYAPLAAHHAPPGGHGVGVEDIGLYLALGVVYAAARLTRGSTPRSTLADVAFWGVRVVEGATDVPHRSTLTLLAVVCGAGHLMGGAA